MNWALIDSNKIVRNIIMYEKNSNYVPPTGLMVKEINPWVRIGQSIDIAEPKTSNGVE